MTSFGHQAIKLGFDYFYLRMRIGIAYYEEKKYDLAAPHFDKALQFNSGDELALEYLYYCYLFTSRNEEARMLSKQFSKELAVKTGVDKQSALGFILFEGGTKLSDSTHYYDKNKKTESNFYNPATYLQLGLNHYIKNRVSFFHAFTYFDQTSFTGTLRQLQYYIKSAIPLKHGWMISPAVQWVNINFSSEKTVVSNPPTPPPHPGMPPPPPPRQTLVTTTTNSSYYIGSLAIQKIVKKFTFSIGTTLSNMSNVTEFIHSGSIYYSLLGNSKLILGCAGYAHTINSYKTTYGSLSPFVFLYPQKNISIKLAYLQNAGNNIIEDNGYFVNNSPDLTRSRYSAMINLYLSKAITFYVVYQLENKLENIQQFTYKYNILVAGLKITP